MADESTPAPLGKVRPAASELHFRRLWQGIGWLMVAVVVWLSVTPHPPQPPSLLTWDKAQHLTAYAGLMYWFRQAFAAHWRWPVFLITLGVVLELLQSMIPLRNGDLVDVVANSLGVGIGLALGRSPLGGLLAAADARIARLGR
ncbi:MAG: VanZ family protein [Gammaproteobacteria bacterium]|nr:VanZ family protein [Gammaproteobacteria bacterium]